MTGKAFLGLNFLFSEGNEMIFSVGNADSITKKSESQAIGLQFYITFPGIVRKEKLIPIIDPGLWDNLTDRIVYCNLNNIIFCNGFNNCVACCVCP